MKVVITSATEKEVLQIKETLTAANSSADARLQVSFHTSGVGMLASCFAVAKLIFEQKPDLIIQAGIAGTFDTNYELGKVVIIKDELLADTGVEENGSFKDLVDLHLLDENSFPFTGRRLHNKFLRKLNYLSLEEVTGITINEITTRSERIEALKVKYRPATESMEGASLHYCCLQTETPFIQIRAVSNYIGERDKSKWNFKDALHNLAGTVVNYLDLLNTKQD